MNAKTSWTLLFVLLAILVFPHGQAADLTDEDAVQVLRSVMKVDREAVVTKALQLTAAESEKFWPLYHEYRAEMDKVGDGLLKVMQNYASFYPDVPQQPAETMLNDLARLEDQQSAVRAEHLKKVGKVLPASKTLRYAQVDNRLALALRVALAAKIPLVPVEGQAKPSSSTAAAVAEGVPGGVVVETHELTATVTAVDSANRRLHLLSAERLQADGHSRARSQQLRPNPSRRQAQDHSDRGTRRADGRPGRESHLRQGRCRQTGAKRSQTRRSGGADDASHCHDQIDRPTEAHRHPAF